MKRINKDDTRSQATAYGGGAVAFGMIFVSIGSFFAAMGFELIPLYGNANAPLWVIGMVGLAFALAGTMVVTYGVRGMLNKRRQARLLEIGRAMPSSTDYPWNPREIRDRPYVRVANGVTFSVFLAVFLAPFNWWAFSSDQGGVMVMIITGIFDLLLLVVIGTTVHRLLRAARFGTSRLSFRQFPFRPGQALQVGFKPRNLDRFDATLRFVEERFETTGSGKNRSTSLVSYEHYAQKKEVETAPGAPEVEIVFDLPGQEEWVTRLSGKPVRYWELLIESSGPGVDFRTTFPLPVYRS